MAQSVYNIAEAVRNWGTEYMALVGYHKYFPAMTALSHIFFVDGGAGSDSADNNGQTPDTPLLTITAALGKCTSGTGDFIFILDYYQASGEVWPIAIAKQRIHIIGSSGKATPWPWVQPTGDTAAFEFQGNSGYSELAGFELGAGANHGCIETTHSGIEGLHIHDLVCGSLNGMTGKHGIYTHTGGVLMKALIENCKFGPLLTGNGIEISGSTGAHSVKGCRIQNNHFKVAGKGIVTSLVVDFADGGIFNNTFICSSNGAGTAVDFYSGSHGAVDKNHAYLVDNVTFLTADVYHGGTTTNGLSPGANYMSGTLCVVTDYHT